MKQLVIFTDAYGKIIFDMDRPYPHYDKINDYLENGWIVLSVTGTGITGAGAAMSATYRGSFCFLLNKI